MNFNDYQQKTRRTAGEFESDSEELIAWSMGIGGEAGEIVDYVKKVIFHGHTFDTRALIKEIGDEMYYLARLSDLLGYPFEEVAKINIQKLEKRYPDGFSEERSVNRDD
jgi:NTP pyrophosphatase (non-canonical NTP hydrolase)